MSDAASTDRALPHVTGGPFAGLRTWFTMLAICLEERLVYRGDFIIGTLIDITKMFGAN